jgi:secreted PhoX family phosphatase
MHIGRVVGFPYPVTWVPIDDPDHDDDTDTRTDRVPGFTPTRIQAQDNGAAFFDRLEGAWATGLGKDARVYFDCTSGGAARLGQVWEYDPYLMTIKLLFESSNPQTLRNPDNMVVVPATRDVFLCEDAGGDQFVRGLTRRGEIYDFARTGINLTEFCGACFDRSGQTLYLNQQGERGSLPDGPVGFRARTYAIFGPFARRLR